MFSFKSHTFSAVMDEVPSKERGCEIKLPYNKLFEYAMKYDTSGSDTDRRKFFDLFRSIRMTGVNEWEAMLLFLSMLVAAVKTADGPKQLSNEDLVKFIKRVADRRYAAAMSERWVKNLFMCLYTEDPKLGEAEFRDFSSGIARCTLVKGDTIVFAFLDLFKLMLPSAAFAPIEQRFKQVSSSGAADYYQDQLDHVGKYCMIGYDPSDEDYVEGKDLIDSYVKTTARKRDKARNMAAIEAEREAKAEKKRAVEQSENSLDEVRKLIEEKRRAKAKAAGGVKKPDVT